MPPDVGGVEEGDIGAEEVGATGLGMVGEGPPKHIMLAKHDSPEGHSLSKPLGHDTWHFEASCQLLPHCVWRARLSG